ncbi:lasso peptide biosynthesis B2 protein [Streptomyces sp. PT12]|uniref:lasso peptide biosynthesis B2 protein n=1 Tax=Streptomyces sp. PT12 TaxID=1510197 RepID=UPI000DE26F16|nr:lasso peptide biosynthesis B2 protein [Streptomyces sp. PT12]RBM07311.1 lasso peptide biosynthesis B2 protein [Streptomyces sp. PT12]
MSQVLPSPAARPPLRRRVPAHAAVAVARLLAHLSPARLTSLLRVARRGAAPASHEQALAARRDVTGSSTFCSGRYCLQRSLATALLCRLRGTWPTWCTGVRTPPFAAHAWVEAEGRPVGEPPEITAFTPLLQVPPGR